MALISIHVSAHPTRDAIRQCWQVLGQDPLKNLVLSDTADCPHVEAFLHAIGVSIVPFVGYVNQDPAILAWLHNIALVNATMRPVSAHVGVYVLPDFRHQHLVRLMAPQFLALVQAQGFEHLWAECRADNVPAKVALEACGFVAVTTLPHWRLYHGIWRDVVLYHTSLAACSEEDDV